MGKEHVIAEGTPPTEGPPLGQPKGMVDYIFSIVDAIKTLFEGIDSKMKKMAKTVNPDVKFGDSGRYKLNVKH